LSYDPKISRTFEAAMAFITELAKFFLLYPICQKLKHQLLSPAVWGIGFEELLPKRQQSRLSQIR
jgi:hypothetical protein